MEANHRYKDGHNEGELAKERNFTEEEEETTNNINDRDEKVESFLKVEDTLNDLFRDILRSKTQLHSNMDTLRNAIIKAREGEKQNLNQDCIRVLKAEKLELEKKVKHLDFDAIEFKESLEKRRQENTKLQREVDELKDRIRKSTTYADQLEKDVMKFLQEKEELSLENTKLKIDAKEEVKRFYDGELKENFEKSQQEKEKILVENSKLKKDLEDQIKKSDIHARELKKNFEKSQQEKEKILVENSKLKKDLEDQIKKSDIHARELKENFEKSQQEKRELVSENIELKDKIRSGESQNADKSSFDSNTWEKVLPNDDNASNSGQKQKSGNESDKSKLDTGYDKEIEFMDNLYNNSWMNICTTLIEEKIIDKLTAQDILHWTLWSCYKLTLDMRNSQRNNSLTKSVSKSVSDIVPGSIKLKPEDSSIQVLKGKLMQNLSTEYKKHTEYLNQQPKFISYVNECLEVCQYLVYESNRVFLKTERLDRIANENCFTICTGSKKGVVVSLIFPALIHLTKDGTLLLRKGIVSTNDMPK